MYGWLTAHAWDIAGADSAGLRTAFIVKEEKEYLSVYPEPEVTTSNLVEAANKIIEVSR